MLTSSLDATIPPGRVYAWVGEVTGIRVHPLPISA